MSSFTFGCKTDVGRVRKLNQDEFVVLTAEALALRADGLFVVADGLGGNRKGGEVASRIAVETVSERVRTRLLDTEVADPDFLLETVQASLQAANTAVWKQANRVQAQHGMGTTCVMAFLQDKTLILGNVGDSRCYRLRAGKLDQLTHDHSFLEAGRGGRGNGEGGRSHFRHVMTRAIGFGSQVEPEIERFLMREGDVLLLCSDGLTNSLDNAEIAPILQAGATPEETCERLVAAANGNGGEDNITVIVVHYGEVVASPSAQEAPQMPAAANSEISVRTSTPSWRQRLGRLLGKNTDH